MPTNIEHVVALINAGFSADEIRAMQQAPADPAAPVAHADPAATADPTAPADPAAPAAPADPVDPAATADMAAVLQSIAALTAAVQANGIATSQQPKQPDRADVLASIIVPNNKGGIQ